MILKTYLFMGMFLHFKDIDICMGTNMRTIMKLKILIGILIFISTNTFGQKKADKKKDTITTKVKVSELDRYKELTEKYLKLVGIDTVGYFKIKESLYTYSLKDTNNEECISKNKKGNNKDCRKSKEKYKIVGAIIEVKEGLMKDIAVKIKKGNDTLTYRNTFPISLIKYNYHFFDWALKYKDESYIYIYDALEYNYKMGKNFISDAAIVQIDSNEKENLVVDYNLNSLIDFRVYSDFLGLINETANGIVNFEATSKIYINYANYYNTHFLKTIKPSVKYSRFDNDDRRVKIDSMSNKIQNTLELVQKQYLNLGVEINLFQFKHVKNAFYTAHIPLRFNYGLAEVDAPDKENSISTGIFSYGSGLNFDFKRLKNFGLKLEISYDRFRQKLNESEINIEKTNFSTIGTNAELYFYDSDKKNSAIFLRLKYKQLLSGLEGSYSSIQFGYKTDLNFSKTE